MSSDFCGNVKVGVIELINQDGWGFDALDTNMGQQSVKRKVIDIIRSVRLVLLCALV